MPPVAASNNDATVKDIYKLGQEISSLSDDEFTSMIEQRTSLNDKTEKKEQGVFIGHGRSKLWARLQIATTEGSRLHF